MFDPGKTYQPSLMFVVKARSIPKVGHIKGVALGFANRRLANIRLGRKGLPGTNTLAYYKNS